MNKINSLGVVSNMPVRCTMKIPLFKKGMSQKKLAEIMNVSPQQVNNWVSGRTIPQMDTLLRLSEILECTINDFYKLEE